jgi:hypothetical protein
MNQQEVECHTWAKKGYSHFLFFGRMEEPISVVNDEKTKCNLTNSGKVNASPDLFLAMTNSWLQRLIE